MDTTFKRKYAVEKTNDSSIVSKASMVSSGYFEDPYVQCFIQKLSRRSSLINRGYYIRAKAMELMFHNFLNLTCNSNVCQVLSLGAGFDSSFFRLKANKLIPSSVKYFEIDFEAVVGRKVAIINDNEQLSDLVGPYTDCSPGLRSKNYDVIPCDLSSLCSLERQLSKFGVDYEIPTLLFSECVITYMDEKDSSKLIRWAASKFKSACFANYEQILPDDGFGNVMKSHFNKLGSSLKSINSYKTIECQKQRFMQLGWDKANAFDMNTLFSNFLEEAERIRVRNLEMFDEFEEFHLKCSHYTLLLATNGVDMEGMHFEGCHQDYSTDASASTKERFQWDPMKDTHVKRYGHSSIVSQKKIITIGGFGSSDGQHKRLNSIHVVDCETSSSHLIDSHHNECNLGRMYHRSVKANDESVVIFGGRFSPMQPCSDIVQLKFQSSSESCVPVVKAQVIGLFNENFRPRWRHSASIFVSNDGQQQILVFGGITTGGLVLNDFAVFELSSCRWIKIECEDSVWARHSHAASLWQDDKIVITGGLSYDDRICSSMLLYHTHSSKWQETMIPGMINRYSHTSNICGDKLLLVGGVSVFLEDSPGLSIVDLKHKVCQNYDLPLQDPEKPLMLHKHSAVKSDDKLFLVGGGGNCFSFGTHFNSDIMKININDYFR